MKAGETRKAIMVLLVGAACPFILEQLYDPNVKLSLDLYLKSFALYISMEIKICGLSACPFYWCLSEE